MDPAFVFRRNDEPSNGFLRTGRTRTDEVPFRRDP
jgi:hypothetical protein